MKKKYYSLKSKLMMVCISLSVLPVLTVGIFSIIKLNSFTKEVISESYKGLEEQAYAIMKSGLNNDFEKINNIIIHMNKTTQRLASSSNIEMYLNAEKYVISKTRQELTNLAKNINSICNVQYKLLLEKKKSGVDYIDYMTQTLTRPYIQASEVMRWNVINQYTFEKKSVDLPTMYFGTEVIRKIKQFYEYSPIVDDVRDLTGVNCTIFQKMNEQGDMLRIASNVKNPDGNRDIETFMPAILPDGRKNPIISSILKKKDYSGLTKEGNEEYFSIYKPFYNDSGQILGILFVGIPVKNETLYNSILDNKINKSIYPFIINGKGNVVLYPKKEVMNKHINNDLNLSNINKVLINAKANNVSYHTYILKNRKKFMAYIYFEPRDWIICVVSNIDDIISEYIHEKQNILKEELKSIYLSNVTNIKDIDYFMLNQIRLINTDGKELIKMVHGKFLDKLNSTNNKDWFKKAFSQNKGTVFNTGVELAENTSLLEMRMISPVYSNNELLCFSVVNFNWNIMKILLSLNDFKKTGIILILNEKGTLLTISHEAHYFKENKTLLDNRYGELSNIVKNSMLKAKTGQASYVLDGIEHLIYYKPFMCGDKQFSICASGHKEDFLQRANSIKIKSEKGFNEIFQIIYVVLSLCIIISFFIGILVSRSILKPLEKVVVFAQDVSKGNLYKTLKTKNKDEIGYLLTAINKMVISFSKIVFDVKAHANNLFGASEEIVSVTNLLNNNAKNMNEQANNVTTTSVQMSSEIHSISNSVELMSNNASNVTYTTEKISKNINKMSLSIEKMTETLNKVGVQATKGSEISEKAVQIAEQTNEKMISLNQATSEIGMVSRMIKHVAYKTNIIAMNAGIEAASAGEAGKGFTVVAKTIKDFAKQTKQSAEDISIRISAVQSSTADAITYIESVLYIIKEIYHFVETILKSINYEIANADKIASHASEVDNLIKNIVTSMSALTDGANTISKNIKKMATNADGVTESIKDVNDRISMGMNEFRHLNSKAQELDNFATNLKDLVSEFNLNENRDNSEF